jgi:hypothetical protein
MERFFLVRKTEDRLAGLRGWEELFCSDIVEVMVFYSVVSVRNVTEVMFLLVVQLALFIALRQACRHDRHDGTLGFSTCLSMW